MKLNKSDQIKIYKYYIDDLVINGGAIQSILPGRKDNHPSFAVFDSSYSDKILWKDFAQPCDGTDAIALVCEMEGISRSQAYDFFKKVIKKHVNSDVVTKVKKHEPELKLQEYLDYHLAYWAKRYQDKQTLIRENIFAGDYLAYNEYRVMESSPDFPMFVYMFDEKKKSWKAYSPNSNPNDKWKTNNLADVIEGINTIPETHDSLIIASSTKDRLAWKLAHPAVINPTGEGSYRNILLNFKDLFLRFPNIYVIFDADDAGWRSANKLSSLTGSKIKPINAAKFTPFYCKDIDDIVVEHGPSSPGIILKKLNIIE